MKMKKVIKALRKESKKHDRRDGLMIIVNESQTELIAYASGEDAVEDAIDRLGECRCLACTVERIQADMSPEMEEVIRAAIDQVMGDVENKSTIMH